MASLDIWANPWELRPAADQSAVIVELTPAGRNYTVEVDCAPILVTDLPNPRIVGQKQELEDLGPVDESRRAYALSLPLKRDKGIEIETTQGAVKFLLPRVPDAPHSDGAQETAEFEHDGGQLFERLKCVWTRLKEVEEVLVDPKHMWRNLADLWQNAATSRPKMDEIVRQARTLLPVVEKLDKTPRRILRRIHTQVALSRVQELDRKSMSWLIRQPGESIAQQAGDRQTIMAVAREENFDTLENRVLHAYARLARKTADDYAPKHLTSLKARHRDVRSFSKRCEKLAKDLSERKIRIARPDVTPNFVLLNNPSYSEIWGAWRRLLEHKRMWDELWPWQARSWEEFCALAVMVALTGIEGARPVATSPILFREEQQSGKWVDCLNPLGVVHLDRQKVIVEVQYGYKTDSLKSWCAPLWLRLGRVNDATAFLKRVPVWPRWSAAGGLLDGEVDSVSSMVAASARALRAGSEAVSGALVIRPAAKAADAETRGRAACVALGATGDALGDGLELLREAIVELFAGDQAA